MAKTRIDVIPFESFCGIRFGTSKQDIHKALGTPMDSFMKCPDDKVETDEYSCFHLYYDDNAIFEAAEVVYVDEADIYYDGEKVPETYDGVLKFFQNRFDDVEEDGACFMSARGSMGVYVDESEDGYDTILFARKGYYDDIDD